MSGFSGGILLRNPREGFRSEYLAFYAFSAFGPAVEYRSENDFGIDLICNIADVSGRYLNVKSTYGVQVKTEDYDFNYNGPSFFDWYFHLEYPFLLCTVSKKTTRIKIYSTWNLMRLYMLNNPNEHWKFPQQIRFLIDEQFDELPVPDFQTGTISVGKPILDFDVLELGDKEKAAKYKTILDEWIEMDRNNHINKRSITWFTSGYVNWETNKSLSETTRRFHTNYFYSPFSYDNSKSAITKHITNVSLYLNHKKALAQDDETKKKCDEELNILKQYVASYCGAFADSFSREILKI